MKQYLYRGLRPDEVTRRILIAKGEDVFEHPTLPCILPFKLSKGPKLTVQDHVNENGLTSGVSTSVSFKVAKRYAKSGKIAKIKRHILTRYKIREYPGNIKEQEIILAMFNGNKEFPLQIIESFIDADFKNGERESGE